MSAGGNAVAKKTIEVIEELSTLYTKAYENLQRYLYSFL